MRKGSISYRARNLRKHGEGRYKSTEDYLPTAQIEKALGAAGIDPAREIIVYGNRGLPSVYFGQLTLRYFGAANARVFHDGIDAWRAAGLALSSAPATCVATWSRTSSGSGPFSRRAASVAH